MSKSELITLSGWAFIAGSFAFITILSGSDPIAFPGSVISTLLLAAGMLSLRAGYGETVSRFGRNILLLGVIGPILLCIVIASMALIYLSGNLTDAEVYFFLAGYLYTHNGVYPGQYQMAFNIMHLMQFLALCGLGSMLLTATTQEMVRV